MRCEPVLVKLPAEFLQPTKVVLGCQPVKIMLHAVFLQVTKVVLPGMPQPRIDYEMNMQLSSVPHYSRELLAKPEKVELSDQSHCETAETCPHTPKTIRVSLPRTGGEQSDSSLDDEPESRMGKTRSLCFPPGLDPPIGTPIHGYLLHKTGNYQPCGWYWKPGGCQNGKACIRCHFCPDGEVKALKKTQRTMMKLGLVTPKAGIAAKCKGSDETHPSFCLDWLPASLAQAEVSHSALHPRSDDETAIAFASIDDRGGDGGCFMKIGSPMVLGLGGGGCLEEEDAVGKIENKNMAVVKGSALYDAHSHR